MASGEAAQLEPLVEIDLDVWLIVGEMWRWACVCSLRVPSPIRLIWNALINNGDVPFLLYRPRHRLCGRRCHQKIGAKSLILFSNGTFILKEKHVYLQISQYYFQGHGLCICISFLICSSNNPPPLCPLKQIRSKPPREQNPAGQTTLESPNT